MTNNQQPDASDGCLWLLIAMIIRIFGPFLLQLLALICIILFFALLGK